MKRSRVARQSRNAKTSVCALKKSRRSARVSRALCNPAVLPSNGMRWLIGAGGGTRTHTTLPSRDFKSLASTSSATSAPLFHNVFSASGNGCFPKLGGRFPNRCEICSRGVLQAPCRVPRCRAAWCSADGMTGGDILFFGRVCSSRVS